MLKGLFLDDERRPWQIREVAYPDDVEWTIVKSFREFALKLREGHKYDVVSFDYWLDQRYNATGMDCLQRFAIVYEYEWPQMYFHTRDEQKAKLMKKEAAKLKEQHENHSS